MLLWVLVGAMLAVVGLRVALHGVDQELGERPRRNLILLVAGMAVFAWVLTR